MEVAKQFKKSVVCTPIINRVVVQQKKLVMMIMLYGIMTFSKHTEPDIENQYNKLVN